MNLRASSKPRREAGRRHRWTPVGVVTRARSGARHAGRDGRVAAQRFGPDWSLGRSGLCHFFIRSCLSGSAGCAQNSRTRCPELRPPKPTMVLRPRSWIDRSDSHRRSACRFSPEGAELDRACRVANGIRAPRRRARALRVGPTAGSHPVPSAPAESRLTARPNSRAPEHPGEQCRSPRRHHLVAPPGSGRDARRLVRRPHRHPDREPDSMSVAAASAITRRPSAFASSTWICTPPACAGDRDPSTWREWICRWQDAR